MVGRHGRRDPVFVAAHSEWMPGHLKTDVWTPEGAEELTGERPRVNA